MDRRQKRYWLFRLKNELEGGSPAEAPEGFVESYEEQEIFKFTQGFGKFGVTWDLDDTGENIVMLDESLWDAWDKHCAEVAKEIPKKVKERIAVDRPEFDDSQEVDVDLNIH